MGKRSEKQPKRPSYEDGELRDPAIKKMQRARRDDLMRLIRKAFKGKAPEGASPQ